MQFSVLALLAIATSAIAFPLVDVRQVSEVTTEEAAMSDGSGNVVPFNTDAVNQPLKNSNQ